MKRKRSTHPRNRYAEGSPDFAALAARYASFARYVRINPSTGRGSIDWRDYAATRELTRVLLDCDYGILGWWIPDGQLCPAVTNRANYIHWIEDLLQGFPAPGKNAEGGVLGLDIGTGASAIYPLLGASLRGWKFVATDVTSVALEWGRRNIAANPHLMELIEVRSAAKNGGEDEEENHRLLVGVVKDEEIFDFSMCNPPFFESMEEAGMNPRTACGGTPEEMVCAGGEAGFVSRLIRESVELGTKIHWYTSMVGKKSSLKALKAEIRGCGATMVKTTEFVQGKTSRWGLAWSFSSAGAVKSGSGRSCFGTGTSSSGSFSFVLEGIDRKCSALEVLGDLGSHLEAGGVACKIDAASFAITGTPGDQREGFDQRNSDGKSEFKATLFQQSPGCLLVKIWISKAGRSSSLLVSALESSESTLKEKLSVST
ncbi:hypothetical protein SELMODRAFT_110877 [Selaginella moellendorffii]|uniref:U6 small nuclear RNA (adenine-(43)-N(6))-methyltransferase n=1 Tax=Selaginella moellendorffii TaxID=88036 RepID=D8S816_SELML|nr:U6 small nuclear RNA (adenine-(43)-N(6))-methyltransferase [Selaginella moellendorffii]EFJ19446.1 hypothetical protein SELMODRAFT_110877 [Selaginella moellendorffii]|eukprot:XP_002979557.1 U6 small nuclear RNA (adenine-(43)-N(6))-methyltransferase [Selaginella moellendorffii]